MIQIVKDTRPWFFLQTTHSTYGMRVMETGHLEHLYYGERITVDTQDPSSCAPLVIQRAFAPGNTCIYTKEQPQISESLFWKFVLLTVVLLLTLPLSLSRF